MKYVIKHNLPTESERENLEWKSAKQARKAFFEISAELAYHWYIKVSYREKPLRGTIQVEIDGFYYYVELYTEE